MTPGEHTHVYQGKEKENGREIGTKAIRGCCQAESNESTRKKEVEYVTDGDGTGDRENGFRRENRHWKSMLDPGIESNREVKNTEFRR